MSRDETQKSVLETLQDEFTDDDSLPPLVPPIKEEPK